MTYIQLTTRCNMTCEHCCFSCTNAGHDMTKETWKKALDFAGGGYVMLGGGEPTMHRHFREFLMDAIAEALDDEFGPSIITNGGTKHADLIFKLTKKGVIQGSLSHDPYHDSIHHDIVENFKSIGAIHDTSKDGNRAPMPKGRALENELYDVDPEENKGDHCTCEGFFIDPKGNLKPCGCVDSPVLCNLNDEDYTEKLDEWQARLNCRLGSECWHHTKEELEEELEEAEEKELLTA